MGNLREEKRKIRLKHVATWIRQANSGGKVIDKEKLIATICMEFGVSRRTALEYINTLINSQTITMNEVEEE